MILIRMKAIWSYTYLQPDSCTLSEKPVTLFLREKGQRQRKKQRKEFEFSLKYFYEQATWVVMGIPQMKKKTTTVTMVKKRIIPLRPNLGNSSTKPVTTVSISTIWRGQEEILFITQCSNTASRTVALSATKWKMVHSFLHSSVHLSSAQSQKWEAREWGAWELLSVWPLMFQKENPQRVRGTLQWVSKFRGLVKQEHILTPPPSLSRNQEPPQATSNNSSKKCLWSLKMAEESQRMEKITFWPDEVPFC